MKRESSDGTVYLLHFDQAYRHAKHYIGWTTDLEARLAEHRDGHGARLMEVVKNAGIGFSLARTWDGGRVRERQLKQMGGASRRCPMCGVTPRRAPTADSAQAMGPVIAQARRDIQARHTNRAAVRPAQRVDASGISAGEIDRICSEIEARRTGRNRGGRTR